ncbi:MAG: hypothetical protein ABIT71_16345 [Vicinamibacteraceae bacterium]
MPTNPTRHVAFLAALIAAPLLAPSLGLAQAPAPQAAQPSAPAAAPASAPVSAAAPAASDEKSLAVLADVRKAIGGDAKIAALKTVSFEGTYRRVQGEQDMTGDLELYFGQPDKFQRVEQFSFGPNPGPRIAQTFNGTEGWMGPLGAVPGGGQFRFGGPGGPGGGPGGGGPGGPGGPGGQRFDPSVMVKQLYWRTALAMFPGTTATSALSFTYVGKAESPDGEADVLDVKGEGTFAARLFVDAKTHLPVMLTYQERERNFRRVQRKEGETDEQFRTRMRAEREAAGPPPPPKMIDISMFITDHKDVGGVKVPHHFTMQTGDKPTEEWELKKSKANPKFDDEQFKRKTSN